MTGRDLHFERLACRRLLSAGDVDTTFGDDGVVVDPTPAHYYSVSETIRLPGDQILIAGQIDFDDTPDSCLIRRYNADGSIDTTFGVGGSVIDNFADGEQSIEQMRRMSDGRLVALIVGPSTGSNSSQHGIARYNADGSRDTSFGDNGFVALADSAADFGLGLQSDGAVVIAHDGLVSRHSLTGQLDTAFGDAGIAHTAVDGPTFVVRQLAGGKILIAGAKSISPTQRDFALARLNADGSVDPTFGDNGTVLTDLTAQGGPGASIHDAAILPDGKILVVGDVSAGGACVRYLPDGDIDATFGDNGVRIVRGQQAFSVVLDDDGRAYVIGAFGEVARLTADGDIDQEFGRVFGPGGRDDWFLNRDAALLSSGRLIIAGAMNPFEADTHIGMVARFTEDDGSPSPIAFADDVITVTGSDHADIITADDNRTGFSTRVRLNNFGRIFDDDGIQLISAFAGSGDDLIDMSAVATIPVLVKGGSGRDRIAGGSLSDTLEGNAQRDFIDGGDGNDLIVGNGGRDKLRGQNGDDSLGGGRGDDYLEGNDGNDHLEGGFDADVLHGNIGDDTFKTDDGDVDQLFGDEGSDSIVARDDDDLLDGIETT